MKGVTEPRCPVCGYVGFRTIDCWWVCDNPECDREIYAEKGMGVE